MPATLEGLDELVEAFRRAEFDLGDQKSAHREGASVVAGEARRDVSSRSGVGPLSRSIRYGATKRGGTVRAGSTRVPYARAYHFGHFNRPQGGFMEPVPFLYDALDERADEVVARYAAFVDKVLRDRF